MPERATSSGATPVLIAAFFLIVPVAVLWVMAQQEQPVHVPSDDYARAVREAMQPNAARVSHSLVSVPLDRPVTVATWMRRNQVSDYEGKTTAPGYKDTWVTVVPNLKTFCQDYAKSHGADPQQLALRLQQRLGLPPASNNDTFVELTVDPKDLSHFFRPCGDPSPNANTCQPLSPPKPADIWKYDFKALGSGDPKEIEKYWILTNYYWSFSSEHQYPWTLLGYTFDWAPKEDGSEDFMRWGESEFVIPAGAPIQFVSKTDTVAYCTPQ